MHFFKRFIFPALYGLLIYFTIRLLHDSEFHQLFWHRSWKLNALEMSVSILMGYAGIACFRWMLRRFDRQQRALDGWEVLRELCIFVGINFVIVNLTVTPLVALTDDGLSYGDLADVNVVSQLFAIIYYGIARSAAFLAAYVDKKVQLEKITNQQLETELKFLRAQYHPHFLFNAINTVYFQMDEDVQAAKQTLEKFSALLRYQLYDQQHPVPVAQEIRYLENYISLQQLRSTGRLQLQVNIDPALHEQRVYPLLLLPLVENAFKYVGGGYHLEISLRQDGPQQLILQVVNDVPESLPAKTQGGIGLENLRRRLELLYPAKHAFSAGLQDGQFIATLQLQTDGPY